MLIISYINQNSLLHNFSLHHSLKIEPQWKRGHFAGNKKRKLGKKTSRQHFHFQLDLHRVMFMVAMPTIIRKYADSLQYKVWYGVVLSLPCFMRAPYHTTMLLYEGTQTVYLVMSWRSHQINREPTFRATAECWPHSTTAPTTTPSTNTPTMLLTPSTNSTETKVSAVYTCTVFQQLKKIMVSVNSSRSGLQVPN